jgi:DNA-3-methyladenine glycosylase
VNEVLKESFFDRAVEQVSRDLLGAVLHAETVTGIVSGTIVETEAYGGPDDLASHAAFRKTGYVKHMWGPPGTIYVYKAYGMYPCFNIVTGQEGDAAAVLLRAISVLQPVLDDRVASGPGRLGRHVGLNTGHNGLLIFDRPFWISPATTAPNAIATAPRVGVKRGDRRHWRFAIAGHPAVSRPRL